MKEILALILINTLPIIVGFTIGHFYSREKFEKVYREGFEKGYFAGYSAGHFDGRNLK